MGLIMQYMCDASDSSFMCFLFRYLLIILLQLLMFCLEIFYCLSVM
jgi:hypothetical protein